MLKMSIKKIKKKKNNQLKILKKLNLKVTMNNKKNKIKFIKC